jgi:hypothetical protein
MTEALTQDELREIAGRHHKGAIIEWLNAVRWHYTLNAAGEPIVGRWYVRMKLAGVDPTNGQQGVTFPAFDKVA